MAPSHEVVFIALLFVVIIIVQHVFKALDGPVITRQGVSPRKAPDTIPLIGNGIKFIQPRQRLFDWFTKCISQHGHETLLITVPSLPPGVIISDPTNLDFVFKNEPVFQKGNFFKDRLWDLFGNGIVNSDGDLWKRQRKAGLQLLTAANMRLVANHELPMLLDKTVAGLLEKTNTLDKVDLDTAILDITTKIMGKMLYGIEFQKQDTFAQAFDYCAGVASERFQNPLWRFTEVLTGSQFRKSLSLVKSRGRQLVSIALSEKSSEISLAHTGLRGISKHFLATLFKTLGDEDLVAESALNFLSAGRDTAAQALSWTFYLLMKHPNVVNEIRRLSEIPATSSLQSTSQPVNPEAISYVTAVFYETLRLYPPIPFEIKQAQDNVQLPDGTFLPKSSIVVWCNWAMNRSEITWGSDALEFRPERWLVDGRMKHREASEFPVFQGGSRLCLGKKMAEMIAVQVISVLVNTFDFVPAFEGEKVSRNHLTLPMENGLEVYVTRWRTSF